MRRALVAGILLCLATMPAHAVDVSQLSDFEADPCFIALSARNAAQHVDAPDSALAEACERAHGSAEVAWDVLTRTWVPRDASTSPGFTPASQTAPTVSAVFMTLIGFVLVYAVLGTPVWVIATALRTSSTPGRVLQRLLVEGLLGIVARLALGAALLVLLGGVPGATMVAAIVVLVAICRVVQPLRTMPGSASGGTTPAAIDAAAPSATATIIAGTVNDTAAAATGLLALTLLARGRWPLLLLAVLLSCVAAIPVVRAARHRVSYPHVGRSIVATALAGGVGFFAFSDVALGSWRGLGATIAAYVIPAVFGAIVVWRAWSSGVAARNDKPPDAQTKSA